MHMHRTHSHGTLNSDHRCVQLVFKAVVMNARDNSWHSYLIVRGEILGFIKDELLLMHLPCGTKEQHRLWSWRRGLEKIQIKFPNWQKPANNRKIAFCAIANRMHKLGGVTQGAACELLRTIAHVIYNSGRIAIFRTNYIEGRALVDSGTSFALPVALFARFFCGGWCPGAVRPHMSRYAILIAIRRRWSHSVGALYIFVIYSSWRHQFIINPQGDKRASCWRQRF